MKRILIAFLGVLLLTSASFAANSKEYTFTTELIECLNRCQFFLDMRLDVNANSAELMSAVMNANNQFEQGKQLMQKYLKDNDENIKRIAIDIVVGIDNLIDGNLRFIELARRKGNTAAQELRGLEDALGEISDQKDKAWRLILDSAVTLPTVIAEIAKEDYPIGPIPFRISKEERHLLLGQLDRSFRDKLTKFDIAREQKKQGREYSLLDLSDFALTVALIYDEISSEKYEEFRLRAYRYEYNL